MPKYVQAIIEVPHDVTIKDAEDYIRSELKCAGGFKHPNDPLHAGLQTLNVKGVKINAATAQKWRSVG